MYPEPHLCIIWQKIGVFLSILGSKVDHSHIIKCVTSQQYEHLNPWIRTLLIWMFWRKNLQPFWIIIELQRYKDWEAIITRCDVFIISLLRSDDLPKEMRRQATIQEFSLSKEHTKLHQHLLDTNGFTSTIWLLS